MQIQNISNSTLHIQSSYPHVVLGPNERIEITEQDYIRYKLDLAQAAGQIKVMGDPHEIKLVEDRPIVTIIKIATLGITEALTKIRYCEDIETLLAWEQEERDTKHRKTILEAIIRRRKKLQRKAGIATLSAKLHQLGT